MWCGGHQNTQLSFGIIIIVEFAIIMVGLILFFRLAKSFQIVNQIFASHPFEKSVCFSHSFCREGRQVIQKF